MTKQIRRPAVEAEGKAWREIEAAFDELVAVPEAHWEERLAALFPEEPKARERVLGLLRAHRLAPEDFLAGVRTSTDPDPERGRFMGDWRLVSRLGEGGTGTVFLASRPSRPGEGLAAVKVLRLEIGTAGLERLQRERQLLTELHHPGIAKLLDAGVSEDGRPYLAVELVDGLPLDSWVATTNPSLDVRLRLAQELCAAVEYLHQHLLAHLDIKPANVIVNREGRPKLVDFGISGLSGERRDEGVQWLTPRYASPEQFGRRPVTTASDVYSLGVVIYELVTGRLPFELSPTPSPGEIALAVCELEAIPASRRLRERGQKSAVALARRVSGDLDAIFARALEKDPAARYRSPAELAEDLGRFLRHEAIRARRAHLIYRLRKGARRHWVAVVALVGLVAGLLSHNFLLREERRRLAASEATEVAARREAEMVTQFLVDLFEVAAPGPPGASLNVTARELLDRGARRIPRELEDRPLLSARIASTIGYVYCRLGDHGRGVTLIEAGIAQLNREVIAEPAAIALERARIETELALCRWSQGEFAEALALSGRALTVRRAQLGSRHPEVARSLNARAHNLLGLGRLAEAEADLREALQILDHEVGADSVLLAEVLNNLGEVLKQAGRPDGAEPLLRRSLAIKERIFAADDPQIAAALDNLAVIEIGRQRYAPAEALLERASEIFERSLGPNSPQLAGTLNNLANLRDEVGRSGEAETLYRRVLEIRHRTDGRDHVGYGIALYNLSCNLESQARYAEARAIAREALTVIGKAVGPEHYLTSYPLLFLARDLCRSATKPAAERQSVDAHARLQAVALATRAAAVLEGSFGLEHPGAVDARKTLAEIEGGC